jgi:hypothetical protein
LEESALSPRELAVRFTNSENYYLPGDPAVQIEAFVRELRLRTAAQ